MEKHHDNLGERRTGGAGSLTQPTTDDEYQSAMNRLMMMAAAEDYDD